MIMKNLAITILSFFLAGILYVNAQDNTCDAKALKEEVKEKLKPGYKYDSSKITRIAFKNEEQAKEIEVPLFIGEKYKFIFNTKAIPAPVVITIYNKPVGSKKRKELYSNKKAMKSGEKIFTWEPEKSRKMYINYTIPASSSQDRGCVVFLLGYKL